GYSAPNAGRPSFATIRRLAQVAPNDSCVARTTACTWGVAIPPSAKLRQKSPTVLSKRNEPSGPLVAGDSGSDQASVIRCSGAPATPLPEGSSTRPRNATGRAATSGGSAVARAWSVGPPPRNEARVSGSGCGSGLGSTLGGGTGCAAAT